MRIDFLGGPRDGDYTYQGDSPPSVYKIPVEANPESYYKVPVDGKTYPYDTAYYSYTLSKLVNPESYVYTFAGVVDA